VEAPLSASAQLGGEEIRRLFAPTDWRAYLDTASYGLPPLATLASLERALEDWRAGRADWQADWDVAGDRCRPLAADLLGAPAGEICLLPAVSVGVGLVASTLEPGDEVVVADDEFRSLLLPLLVAQDARGVRVRRVPFNTLAESVGDSTTLVATSHVRSNGGGVQDLAAVAEAAREHGADVLVDATHSAGVLPISAKLLGLEYVVAAAYKHLLCPRGVAFMRIAPECWRRLKPWNANWRSTRDPYAGYYGGSLDELAEDAARYDVSLAWHPWVGALESLRFLASIDASECARHCVGLASALAEGLGIRPTGSSILGVPVRTDADETRATLAKARIAVGFPAGQVRLSFHIYNNEDDVEYAAGVLAGLLDS
jgi:selenocysteine lyase/cysteine desulfurase